ncbi:YjzD family protein [Bacillus massiliigorillae]|uniref:YjzD family protein n=1 Tax=Bacillus massiliigorillae TaxID=1243664 RepID=UPI00039F8F7D|nr:YjzD family protein [Bacillus massiliigorillae]
MRFLVTFFWVFLLLQMIVYVVSSMNGAAYDFNNGLVLTIPVSILVCIVPLLLPNDPVEQHH